MKTLITISLLFTLNAFAQSDEEKAQAVKKNLDYGDKQLLQRDVCRKPIEYLETRYSNIPKSQLEKMKSECKY